MTYRHPWQGYGRDEWKRKEVRGSRSLGVGEWCGEGKKQERRQRRYQSGTRDSAALVNWVFGNELREKAPATDVRWDSPWIDSRQEPTSKEEQMTLVVGRRGGTRGDVGNLCVLA